MHDETTQFIIVKYTFKAIVYIFVEKTAEDYGDAPFSSVQLIKIIDKKVRNRLSLTEMLRDLGYEEGLRAWFETRPPPEARV
ncbi:hypothetical protein F2Q70_00030845 [Brassica cretica]|uniref:Uncharacterized protein n=1 Tax=Brassica cretica TaxID=69181 RepID=A0A8S9GUL5_BRACR|nr:hypothetical protein F2Q70_00030845 [Brassica cretica]KAF2549965.1 hypothetical protein F2Q68_00035231 [Brassica cretica]